MKLLDSETATQDLATEQTVLTHALPATPDPVRLFAEIRGDGLLGGGYTIRGRAAGGDLVFESDVIRDAGDNLFDIEMLARGGGTVYLTLQNHSGAAENRLCGAWLATDDTDAILTDTDALEQRVTADRAAKIDNLDAATSTRAVPADVHVTVAPGASRRPPTRTGGTFRLPEGSAETVAWHIEDSAGEDWNFTDYTTIQMQVYDRKGTLRFERTLAAGHITVVDASGGDLSVTFTAANLATEGTYTYELWGAKPDEEPVHVVGGPFVVENTFGPGE